MPAMSAVPAMHEHVHKDAGERQKPNQRSQKVCAMFGEEQEAGNYEESKQHEPCAGIQ
jgi:hypothetical protein